WPRLPPPPRLEQSGSPPCHCPPPQSASCRTTHLRCRHRCHCRTNRHRAHFVFGHPRRGIGRVIGQAVGAAFSSPVEGHEHRVVTNRGAQYGPRPDESALGLHLHHVCLFHTEAMRQERVHFHIGAGLSRTEFRYPPSLRTALVVLEHPASDEVQRRIGAHVILGCVMVHCNHARALVGCVEAVEEHVRRTWVRCALGSGARPEEIFACVESLVSN